MGEHGLADAILQNLQNIRNFPFPAESFLSLRTLLWLKIPNSGSTMGSLQGTVWKKIKGKQQAATRFKERIVN